MFSLYIEKHFLESKSIHTFQDEEKQKYTYFLRYLCLINVKSYLCIFRKFTIHTHVLYAQTNFITKIHTFQPNYITLILNNVEHT